MSSIICLFFRSIFVSFFNAQEYKAHVAVNPTMAGVKMPH